MLFNEVLYSYPKFQTNVYKIWEDDVDSFVSISILAKIQIKLINHKRLKQK